MTKPGNQPQLVDAAYEAFRDCEDEQVKWLLGPHVRMIIVTDIRFPQPDEHECL